MMATTVELSSDKDHSVTGNPEHDNWIRVIEYLAKFKTELWMLHDVFEMAPKQLPDNLGEQTNEMVAFRCLASLFDSSGKSQELVSKSKIEFDSSLSCEHVLQSILDEIPLSELKPGAPGLSKWNLVPFIESKLLCLPQCALELMIETFNEKDLCQGEEEGMRVDGKETDQVTSGHGPGDGAEKISRSQESLENGSEGHVKDLCQGEEEGMRVDGKETDQVTSPMADPKPFGHSPGDGADESNRSHASLENGSDGYVASPSENRYRCIQCKESGKLLFCSRDGCTVMVHEKCVVDSPPVFDDAGNFYCSLCAFGCFSAEYLKSQEEVAKAKKRLLSFLSIMSKVNEKKKPLKV